MKKLFFLAAALGVCVCALISCRPKPAFDAGKPLSAKELEALRHSLENADDKADEPTDDANAPLDENKTIVYYIGTSEVYHSNRECSYLKKSENVNEGSLEQAKIAGKTRLCAACARDCEQEDIPDGNGENAGGGTLSAGNQNGENKTIVYYTQNGEAYHFDSNCTYLKGSSLVREGALEDALAAGKDRPCSRCGD